MVKEKWTIIDLKTQIASLVILIIGIIIGCSILLTYLIDIIFGISASWVLSIIVVLVIFCIAIDFILLLYYTGRKIELRKKKDRKNQKNLNAKLIIVIVIFIISIVSLNYIYSLKPYDGMSIKDITDNPEKFNNQTISVQAFYVHRDYGSYVYQESYFHDRGSGRSYLGIRMEDDIDQSMLIDGREYIWNGIFHHEPYTQDYTYDNVTYTKTGNYTYLTVSKIETLYDDSERHDINKFVGSWKLIEYNGEPYSKNSTWEFNTNNTLRMINKSRGDIPLDTYEHFAVDSVEDILYYEQRDYLFDEFEVTGTICKFELSENDTQLTLETIDGDMIFAPDGVIRVFQKI